MEYIKKELKEENDLISVIVPVYKVETFIDKCVQSIVEQTYYNLQIILVDDGSPDHCGEICDKWAEKDSRITVIHKENGGLSDARNAGLKVAKGDYIGFVDSDDWIAPQMYEVMRKVLIKEQADMVACGIVDCFGEKTEKHEMPYSVGNSEMFLKRIYMDTVFPVSALNKLYKKELWENFQFPVGKICEDAFTTYKLVDRAHRIVQIPELFYYYRIRDNSIMTTQFNAKRMDEEEAWRNNYQFMKRNYPHIAKLAYDFYIQKVNVVFHKIPREQYELFQAEYIYLSTILNDNLKYVIFRSNLSLKYRIYYLVDMIKIKWREKKI